MSSIVIYNIDFFTIRRSELPEIPLRRIKWVSPLILHGYNLINPTISKWRVSQYIESFPENEL